MLQSTIVSHYVTKREDVFGSSSSSSGSGSIPISDGRFAKDRAVGGFGGVDTIPVSETQNAKYFQGRKLLSGDDCIFVVQYVATNDGIYGLGNTIDRQSAYMKMDVKRYGVYVLVRDLCYLDILKNLKWIRNFIVVDNSFKHFCYQFWESLTVDDEATLQRGHLVLLMCDTWSLSLQLYQFLRRQISNKFSALSHYISIPVTYTIELFLLMYVHYLQEQSPDINLYFVWLNSSFVQNNDIVAHDFTEMCFDIETISSDAERVPTGECASDVLMSVCISTHSPSSSSSSSSSTYICELFILLPLEGDATNPVSVAMEQYRNKLKATSEGATYTEMKITVFYSELDILLATLQQFTRPDDYILLGYNSNAYDMMFLFNRCMFYRQYDYAGRFIMNHGTLVYTSQMIHLDVMLYIQRFFTEMFSFSLNSIASSLLKRTKVDLDSVLIRHTFSEILEKQTFENLTADVPSVYDILYYNMIDVQLVCDVWKTLGYTQSYEFWSNGGLKPLVRVQNVAVLEFILPPIVRSFFLRHIFIQYMTDKMYIFQDAQLIDMFTQNDYTSHKTASKTIRLAGGLNYCNGRAFYENVSVFDFKRYYPRMIVGYGISHETICIYPLAKIIDLVEKYNFDLTTVRIFIYASHKLENKNKSDVTVNNCLNHNDISGFEIYNNIEILRRYFEMAGNFLCILIKTSKQTLLGSILDEQNTIREECNESRKKMQMYIEILKNCLMLSYGKKINNGAEKKKTLNLQQFEETKANRRMATYHISLLTTLQKNVLDKLSTVSIQSLINLAEGEYKRLEGFYMFLKRCNASFFGCLGTERGPFQCIMGAAAITATGRRDLLTTAHQAQNLNYIVAYMDTDSIMIVPPKSEIALKQDYFIRDVIAQINSEYEVSEKVHRCIYFLAKKTYIYVTKDEKIESRGLSKNCPKLWRWVIDLLVEKFMIKKDMLKSIDEIAEILEYIFTTTYEKYRQNESEIVISTKCQHIDSYINKNTKRYELLSYITEKYPNYRIPKKVAFFYKISPCNNFSECLMRPAFELSSTYIGQLNLYKFYDENKVVMWQLINLGLSHFFEKYNKQLIPLNLSYFQELMLKSFITVRSRILIEPSVST